MRRLLVAASLAAVCAPLGVTSAFAQACTSDQQVVADIYRQVLEREPDRESRSILYDVSTGRGTVRENVLLAATSEEHQRRFLWPAVVDALFRATRNARPPDEIIRSGSEELARGQMTVPELAARFAADEALTSPPLSRQLVLYKRLLGREPEAGLDGAPLDTPDAVLSAAQRIVASEEYAQRFGPQGVPLAGPSAYTASVRVLYRHLLGRDADAAGLQEYTRMAAQSGLPAVVQALAGSTEYEQRFGDHAVPGPGRGRSRACAGQERTGREPRVTTPADEAPATRPTRRRWPFGQPQ